jgi:RNA polymerase sigma-70 factor (ECF subfamily)
MNRFDGMRYQEIANKLNVSVRTVEVRIGRGLHMLRDYLKDFLAKGGE